MPQMSPLWWTNLMMVFILMFIILMSMLYFNYTKKVTYKDEMTSNKMNWKW